ncbi:MAG: enoyl-CoA hydratase/isomerase family protein [Chitinophagaceae bacterium]|nr:enoyl-CoA hydratase/isomerase family protein [Chitinophagaceae bacterium]
MPYQTLLAVLEHHILTITINRPDKMNALNSNVLDELNAVLDKVENHHEIKAVIITGAGPKAFVAGADISEFNGIDKSAAMAMAKKGQDIFFRIERSAKPIVAAVNGFALGGGCELAMSCHFRIASDNARFGQPEVNLGLIPGYGGTQRLVQLVGKGKAMELLMSANMLDAAAALQWGLVNHVCTQEQLIEQCKQILNTIISKAPLAVAGCIKAANAVYDETVNGFELEINEFGNCFGTADMKEGVGAFLEKRKPAFKGA